MEVLYTSSTVILICFGVYTYILFYDSILVYNFFLLSQQDFMSEVVLEFDKHKFPLHLIAPKHTGCL